ncbi:helix-turn-helix domain-containing protein [Candidatus Microgenomates bacterium]|nr:helix-turn-helix domain-containing protein [Candidatus Microgenomates bacterium]
MVKERRERAGSDIKTEGGLVGGERSIFSHQSEPTAGSLPDELLTVGDVAGIFHVGPRTVWRWCRSGKLPAFRLGHEWRVSKDALNAMIEKAVSQNAQ